MRLVTPSPAVMQHVHHGTPWGWLIGGGLTLLALGVLGTLLRFEAWGSASVRTTE